MYRYLISALVVLFLSTASHAQWTVKQLNNQLDEDPGGQWSVNTLTKVVTILQANADETYVLRATFGTDPDNDPLDEIGAIESVLTSGTIRVMVAGDTSGTLPGATKVKKIDIERGTVLSQIEGINITGDFLETAAGPLWGYRADDPAWTSAVGEVIAVLDAGGPSVERRLGRALHNLPWDSLDDSGD